MTDRMLALLLTTVGALMLSLQAWTKPEPDPRAIDAQADNLTTPRLWHGRVAPEFQLPLLDGGIFRLSDHIGQRAVIINFFATWCGPCRAEMPELQRYAQSLAGEPVILVGVDAEEQRAVVERFVKQVNTTFPIALDQEGDVIKAYRVSAFPTTVVIGADGRVKSYESGAIVNAEVSLAGTLAPELETLRAGGGITLDGFRAALKAQPLLPSDRADEDPGAPTSGRHSRVRPGCVRVLLPGLRVRDPAKTVGLRSPVTGVSYGGC
jgi:thiol-disulfide isomerase/thioredoxin